MKTHEGGRSPLTAPFFFWRTMLNKLFSDLYLYAERGREESIQVTALSCAASWVVLWVIGPWLAPMNASRAEIATIGIISVFVHELGHWYAYRRFGVNAQHYLRGHRGRRGR